MVSSRRTSRSTKLLLLVAAAQVTIAADCNTYTTTGPTGNQIYNNYAFYDFRNLGKQVSGTPVYSQNVDFPNGQFALSTSSYFNSTPWTSHWSNINYKQPQNPKKSQYIDMVYTPLNVAIGKISKLLPQNT